LGDENLFRYIATYDTEDHAEADYNALVDLHMEGWVGSDDAAIVSRDEYGKVHVFKEELPTQHGG